MASPQFQSPDEFKEVMDKTFALMNEDPDMGPKLRDADTAAAVRVRRPRSRRATSASAREGEEGNLHWKWSDAVDWEPRVRMTMSSETANRYFQGKENVAMAIARRKIKTGGDVKAALALIRRSPSRSTRATARWSRRSTRTSSSDASAGRESIDTQGSRSRPRGHQKAGKCGPQPSQGVACLTNAAGQGSGPHCPQAAGPCQTGSAAFFAATGRVTRS